MKVLVLGNINSKWVKEYIEYVLLPLGHNVDVVGNAGTCKYADFYKIKNVTVHREYGPSGLTKKIPFIRIMSSASRIVKNNQWGDYDVIVNMFVNHRDLRITQKLKSKKTKTILYYTGSDLLRKSKFSLLLNRIFLRHPTKHVVGSTMLARGFEDKYPKTISADTIRFGVSAFENIKEYKKTFQKDSTKKVFCVGYSGVREHNHLEVLDLFERLTVEQKEKVKLVVPMTYAATGQYLETVRNKLDRVGIEYCHITEFMDNDAMAEMWCGIDYFINAQSTDSLSASVLEAMYAGAVLLNACWLDYPEYKEFGIKYLPFSNYDELLGQIVDILDDRELDKGYIAHEILEKNMSWASAKAAWEKAFIQLEHN